MRFHRGAWVHFDLDGEVPGAHRNKDGKYVGIYHPASTDRLGNQQPELVYLVNGLGENIPMGNTPLALPPDKLKNLARIKSRDEVPAARLAGNPTWKPR